MRRKSAWILGEMGESASFFGKIKKRVNPSVGYKFRVGVVVAWGHED
jgi:hypothetical protein